MRKESTSFLDRPVLKGIPLNWWTLIYVALLLLAVATRFWDLGSRAYCHDESIHASWSWDLYTGRGYRYNPVYHGPFLYHITAFIFTLFGDSDVTGRVAPVLFGLGVVLLPLFMKRWLGTKGTLIATALLVISPIMMHRSRYIRHDIFAIFFEMVVALAILNYLEKRKEIYLYIMAGALGLAFCVKATSYIYLAIFGSFFLIYFLVRLFAARERLLPLRLGKDFPLRKYAEFDVIALMVTVLLPLMTALPAKLLGFDPIDYSDVGIQRSMIVFAALLALSVVTGLWWDRKRWLISMALFFVPFTVFYSTVFTNGQGFPTGIVGALGYWLSQHDVARGGQPWFYYLLLVPMYEFLPLLFSLLGIGYGLFKWRGQNVEDEAALQVAESERPAKRTAEEETPRAPFVPFAIYWMVTSFLVYSWAGEKMPWLAMNIVVPVALVAGWYLGQMFDKIDWRAFREGRGWIAVALWPLLVTVIVTAVQAKPFQGTSLDQLTATMQWLVAALCAIAAVVLLYLLGRKLGGKGMLQSLFVTSLIVLTALTVRFAWMGTFKNGDVATEMMIYAQGTPDVPLVMKELTELSERTVGGLDLKVAYDDLSSWPFVWYLRNFKNAQYYAKKPGAPFDAPVVIVGTGNEAAVKPYLGGKYFRREYKLIWWPTEAYKDLTLSKIWSGLRDAESRKNFWNIFFSREYAYGLDNWPHYNPFILYVRKDVAAQLWDYGPEIIATEVTLPGEDYEAKYKQIPALEFWGSQGAGEGQLSYPKGVALDAQGNAYVADSQNHRVVKYDAQGRFVMQFGSQGSAAGQFNEPWGVAVGPDGSIYVADTWNHRVQKFDAAGQFQTMWGLFGDVGGVAQGGENLFYGPRDIAVDANGDVYVTDTGNKRVVKFSASGQYLGQWGGTGVEVGQFMEPVGLAVDSQGNFYVADTWNRRIQKFDRNWVPVAQWPFVGWEGESVVNKPYLDVDGQGNLYITDPEMFRVVKFDGKGAVQAVWGQYGSDQSSLNLPTGIAVDGAGNVYVTDSNNHRLVKYGPIN